MWLHSYNKATFWDGPPGMWGKKAGCYVIAIKHGSILWPLYIGQTNDGTFEMECFADHKVNLLQEELHKSRQLELFLLVCAQRRVVNGRHIDDLEQLLIEFTSPKKRVRLHNKQHNRGHVWSLKGFGQPGIILKKTSKAPDDPVMQFARMLGWEVTGS